MSSQKISMTELEHIAKLARINLSESEKNTFLPQLESVLNSFDILNKVDIDNIEPTFRVNEQSNIFHQDEIGESLPQSVALSTAVVTKDGYFVVTNTIKK
ncbi:MAG: Asp-tRNA(Asn)/Glu-tRNA(Gln) amidotransferase subunit GatC [Candidatus Shapirobacteria bacterium]|nr:Asp-tRNA(Asn)/Glu-tRNA(Gln) amidotransferase subunit GatC [Candidatus Shapirobacteria bacterium]MDD3002398.1 Asp-tRNA(Asn)/Glu-tRNA(Gln) amidotransferase subunit GatC [Candidatus Shapirobacteria bacterium]MDD4383294.1 Asp-tRNA(Asn)/Glu-tRNA(Gln) amidotransferase subunit GatC [Candidatus Shapirobacteria bacterium]